MRRGSCCLLFVLLCLPLAEGAAPPSRGDGMPDFSHCGYAGGDRPVPVAPVRVVVEAKKGDATRRIQAAIDHVAGLKADRDGLRGAVLLLAGRHEVAGHLRLGASGIVLRGQKGTTVVATGTGRRTLIQLRGAADRKMAAKSYAVTDRYVPVGATRLRLDGKGLKAGDRVLVERPSTKGWIAALRMDRFPTDGKGSWQDWRPGTLDLRFDRVVTKADGETVTLDAPLTTALDRDHGGGTARVYSWPGRITNVGVENLRLESEYDTKNPHDEEHSWVAVAVENAEDAWVRRVTMAHFAGSAVSVFETSRAVTVEDCESVDPVSEVGGYRRHTFYVSGSQVLFRRCKSTAGRHDFAAGYLAAGPNAFVHCEASDAHQFSGPIESWASGVLYDNVTLDGGALALTNRETDGHGVGWAAANCVLYQCTAPVIVCRAPPGARNWAIGCWGQFVGEGSWRSMNQAVKPASLCEAQLTERLGAGRAEKVLAKAAIPADPRGVKTVEELAGDVLKKRAEQAKLRPITTKEGRLVCDGRLVAGGELGTVWWRGHVLQAKAAEMGAGVTRFVPGRSGPGYTDDLDELTDAMRARGQAVIHHHYGLWYDRRRDDHQMVRRPDGEVWPPFYELPWARSGQGKAWDGLSKYDLTKFNHWYFARLKELADHCDRKGLLLVHHAYFQHNLLEAGAHWADFPWRPANCLQKTGFPEPPPYVNKKRVFMAEEFYDVEHPVRRALHRAYLRHCLDVLGDNTNVVFLTAEEFTGPLSFVQFWMDTVAQWEKEKGKKVRVGLSATRDVQDAILKDSARGPRVSVIDLKYWWYTADGHTYDPNSGSLAPRQQMREWKGSKSRSGESIARMVAEYRGRYPEKVVLCPLAPADGWAVLAAGGSVANLPPLGDDLRAALPRMRPSAIRSLTARQRAMADEGRDYLVLSFGGETVRLTPSDATATYAAHWVDARTGATRAAVGEVRGGREFEIRVPGGKPSLLWLTRTR